MISPSYLKKCIQLMRAGVKRRLYDIRNNISSIGAYYVYCGRQVSGRFSVPAYTFIGIGMLFGCDGIAGIEFDNFTMTEYICNIALGFIMFYGGFNTKWKTARPVAVKAVLLSTCGVILTAAFTMLFCYFVLRFPIAESFLVGAVLSATDAASVFAILRRKKLNLKDGVASLLEIESGSNDPIAYMLTVIGIYILNGDNLIKVPYVIFAQIVYGVLIGIGLAVAAIYVLTRTDIIVNGLDTIFILAVVLLGLGLSQLVGGNEFLCIYLLVFCLVTAGYAIKVILFHFLMV